MFNAASALLTATPPVLAQLFSDVGGYLFGTEFLTALATLLATILTDYVTRLLGPLLGIGP